MAEQSKQDTTQDAGFSAEPPKEGGHYWIRRQLITGEWEELIASLKGGLWNILEWDEERTTEDLIEWQWQFGPRIPSPSESAYLTALHAEVERLRGAAKASLFILGMAVKKNGGWIPTDELDVTSLELAAKFTAERLSAALTPTATGGEANERR